VPVSVVMDTTNRECPHDCWYCYIAQYSPNRPLFTEGAELPLERTCAVVSEMASAGVRGIEFCGAREPLSYPHILPLIRHVVDSGLELGLITNGTCLTDELAELLATRASWVRVSIDSLKANTYNRIRRPRGSKHSLEEVGNSIRRLGEVKIRSGSSTVLGLSTVVEPRNVSELFQLARFGKERGFSFHRFCTVTHPKSQALFRRVDWTAVTRQLERARRALVDDRYSIMEPIAPAPSGPTSLPRCYRACYFSLLTVVVDAELQVYPCAETKWRPEFLLGDLKSDSFRAVMQASRRLSLAREVDHCPPCCRQAANEALEKALLSQPDITPLAGPASSYGDSVFLCRYTSTDTARRR